MKIEEYAKKRRLALGEDTLKAHVSVLRHFELVTGCYGREPTLEDVEYYIVNAMDKNFMQELGKPPLKKTTLAFYLNVIKQYFRTMRLPGRDELHDLFLMMRPKVRQEDYKRTILTEKEVSKILHHADEPYDLAFALGYCCCRRLGEVLMLKGTDIHDDRITFNILKKKETIRRDLPMYLLPEQWRERLLEYKGKREYVIGLTARAVEYGFKRALKRAEVNKDARFHDLRHSIIVHLLDRGVSARVIKDQLSFHESIEMIYRIYGRIPQEAEFRIPKVDWV